MDETNTREAEATRKQRQRDELAELVHACRLGHDGTPWFNWIGPEPAFGTVRVGEEIHMELHALSFDLAVAICIAIQSYQDARGWPPGWRSLPAHVDHG